MVFHPPSQKKLTASRKVPLAEDLELTKPQGALYTPYICGLSERLDMLCGLLNICNAFATANSLRQVITRVKSQVPEEKRKGIVYQVPCEDCNGVYTSEPKRTLKVKLIEHKHAVVRSNINNGITVHIAKNECSIDWESARVMRSMRGYWERRATEARGRDP